MMAMSTKIANDTRNSFLSLPNPKGIGPINPKTENFTLDFPSVGIKNMLLSIIIIPTKTKNMPI